jgi:Fic family protein
MKITQEQKIEFLYHSNMIENIQFPIELYKQVPCSNYHEIKGHTRALQYVLTNFKENLSQKHILKIHKLISECLVDKKYCGKYRNVPVYIGGRQGTMAIAIKPEMEELIKQVKNADSKEDCWGIHDGFEIIHPFIDCNGRTGRLILVWMFLHNNLGFPIVKFEDRWQYYKKIEEYRMTNNYIQWQNKFENIP